MIRVLRSLRLLHGFHRLGIFWFCGFLGLALFFVAEDVRIWSNVRSAELERIKHTLGSGRYVIFPPGFDRWSPSSNLLEQLTISLFVGAGGYAALTGFGWALSGFFPSPDRTNPGPNQIGERGSL